MLDSRELLTLILLIGSSAVGSSEINDKNNTREACPTIGRGDFSLNLTGVGLRSLPDGFVSSEYLTHLILDDNQISTISQHTFSLVPQLSYLSLAGNKLSALDLNLFSDLRNLKTLILNRNCKPRSTSDYNRPQYVYIKMKLYDPNNFCSLQLDSHLPSLRKLYVEENSLQKLSFTSGKFPALTHLYLGNNPLKIDEDTMSGLRESAPALTHLYLNRSGTLEFDVSMLVTLKALYIEENGIHSICNKICSGNSSLKLKGARDLEVLSASRNQISKIEIESFNYTINLTVLDLSRNKISEIKEGTFDKLQNLRSLSLEYNNILKLNAGHIFRHLISLKKLYLSHNNVSNITGGVFQSLIKLETITLDDNRISVIDSGTFSNLTNLKELSLAGNRLSNIPEGSLPTSGSLVSLNLDDNRFTSVENISITKALDMLSLSLKDNPLTGMTSRWFLALPPNLNIILGSSCYDKNYNYSTI